MPQTPLSKKTKTELFEEYRKLQERYDELKVTSQFIHEPENLELFERTKDYTTDNLTQSITELKNSLNATLNQLTDKLLAESQKLAELQKAIELSKKNLELHYHVQVGAETLQNLVEEQGRKQKEFAEVQERQARDWEREKEEYDYQTKLKRRREEEAHQEERIKKEKELTEREQVLTSQEETLQTLKAQVEEFPGRIEKALSQKEEDVAKSLKEEFARLQDSAKKEWQAEKNIYDLKIQNLQDIIKRQQIEIASLRQEEEQASKKAQELAVKIIEAGAPPHAQGEEEKPQA